MGFLVRCCSRAPGRHHALVPIPDLGINKTQQRQQYNLALVDGDGFQLQGKTELSLAPGEIVDIPVSVAMTTDRPSSSSQKISFMITDSDDPSVHSVAQSRFVAPLNR